MKIKQFLSILALLIFFASNVMAYNFEIKPGGSVDVTGQSSIIFDILFNPGAGGNTFGTYAFNLFYDTSELQWNSGATSVTPPLPLTPQFGSPTELTSGHITNFNGGSFDPDPTITTSTQLARISFSILNPALDGSSDIWFDTDPNYTFTIDSQNVSLTMQNTVNGADVAVVPEPISSILFLAGGSVFGIRRYWKKA